jgi:hypothetical protein
MVSTRCIGRLTGSERHPETRRSLPNSGGTHDSEDRGGDESMC